MIFIDSNIFMYAAGQKSPQRIPCQEFLEKAGFKESRSNFCTSAEVLQEILHRYYSKRVPEIGFKIFDSIMALEIPILRIDLPDMVIAKNLMLEYPHLSTRDAVHLGVMRNHDMDEIVSYDNDFSIVEWVKRREP